MVTYNATRNDSEQCLEYIGKHKRAFEIYEDLYPLKLFEDFVQVHSTEGGLVSTACSVDKDRLYPARFGFAFSSKKETQISHSLQQQLQAFLNFFHEVENRVEVKLNYQLIQQFFGAHTDFKGVLAITVGVEARSEIADSRLKLYVVLQNAPEKIETAIALCGDSPTLRAFLVNDNLVVGFDLFLDGRSEIEVYPLISQYELRLAHIRSRIIPLLPPRALPLLDQCEFFQVGFSRSNESNILYFDTFSDPNNIIDNLGNEMAKKVHAYYRHQVVNSMEVGVPEKEFYARSIEQVKLYYRDNANFADIPAL